MKQLRSENSEDDKVMLKKMKGIFDEGDVYHIQGLIDEGRWSKKFGDREQELVLIGVDLDKTNISIGSTQYHNKKTLKQISKKVRSELDTSRPYSLHFDGAMIGRAAIGNPWFFKQVKHYFKTDSDRTVMMNKSQI